MSAPRKGIALKTDIGATILPGSPPTILDRDQITVDPELQPRAGNNQALVDQYAETLQERNWLPDAPLLVVGTSGTRWLVDGHNRLLAAERAGIAKIPVRIIPGDYQDALRLSLGVNADHGLQRSGDDLRRAYRKAVDQQFCAAHDVSAVAGLLKCSERWARELTQAAREQVKAARDAEIQKRADAGETQREIAASVGMTQRGVGKAIEKKRNTSESSKNSDTGAKEQGEDLDAARPPAGNPSPTPAIVPTKKEAMHAAHAVTGALAVLRKFEAVLRAEDARTLIHSLREALARLEQRLTEVDAEGCDHG
ncbi:hypothetical protein CCR95_14345 [Thiocystis minor]|uniref:ParB/RepB/Spo0J family partition protein n=1 Tax=Thiocystis minor TaxID=61597 RepID=UPI0019118C5B|nr:ParB/RepB/Spo0J family partition protein [Thiocystis minor]MBK5965236.1 hypothetical protein [Thiocystis minor]